MKTRVWVFLAVILISVVAFSLLTAGGADKDEIPIGEVKVGEFKIEINATGELQAENSKLISTPPSIWLLRLRNIKITDLVSEGTMVDSGDYVATLDKSELNNRIENHKQEIDELDRQISNLILDTVLQMKEIEDKIENIKFSIEEAEIRLEQSKYEPPAIQRQNKLNLESLQRQRDQIKRNAGMKRRKLNRKVNVLKTKREKLESELKQMDEVASEFTIKAPASGMIIYYRRGRRGKIEVGDNVSPWRPNIATLPDLSSFISATTVNETDIRKIHNGQKVSITIDAFPDKLFEGVVTSMSNIGFATKNNGAKAFEVIVKLKQNDPKLRPSMTTNNRILVEQYEKKMFVPLEAVHSNDSITYVFKSGFNVVKQEVKVGKANENSIIVEAGLQKGDKILLGYAPNADELPFEQLR